MVSVNTAASYIYEKYKSEFGTTIDEMKLHKLLYFAQWESIIHAMAKTIIIRRIKLCIRIHSFRINILCKIEKF